MGKNGALIIDEKNHIIDIPAFADNAVDKIGAGDHLFAISALAIGSGLSLRFSLFLGSLYAAMSTKQTGNKNPVNWQNIKSFALNIYK